jgi:Spy/CpxP family protein refolding chaperone
MSERTIFHNFHNILEKKMKKTNWTLRIAIGFIVVVVIGTSVWVSHDAFAQRGGNIHVLRHQDHEGGLGQMNPFKAHFASIMQAMKDLNLTDEQKEQLNEIRENTKAEVEPIVDTLQNKHDALHDAVTADEPDETAIRDIAAELGNTIGDLAVVLSGTYQEVKPILSEEQLEIVEEMMEKRKDMRQNRKERIHSFLEKLHEAHNSDN